MIEKDDLANFLADSLNKEFNDGKVAYFLDHDTSPTAITDFVGTGSSLLDLAVSNRPNGGLAVGRITEINGLEASGKSLLGAHILAETQKKGGVAVYIDTETSVNKEFLNAVGLPTLQGYGLTEASPVVSCNLPNLVKVDSVGPPFRTNKVKIAEDGEILIKGENVMLGYWNLKEETKKVIKDDWLHTGDIGEFDNNNYLKITDRKKDIIVNLGGDNISPSKVENILCLNENIKQSFVYGDKKNYLVALIVSEKENDKEKIKLIIENINKKLTLIEKIKKFVLIHQEFTIENGMLTPTLKLKRKEIIKNYKQQLENLY